MKVVPNVITLCRLLLVPLTVWLILKGMLAAAFWVFIAAGISDAVDGFLAKRFNAVTVLGGYLDPLADKALLVSVYVTMGHEGYLATWLVILVVFRDALIIGGALLFQTVTQSLKIQPLMVSKVNTTAQILLAAAALGLNGFGMDAHWVASILVPIVAATTVLSGAAYVMKWGWMAIKMEDKE